MKIIDKNPAKEFKKERDNTDDSLGAEREKTNRSLSQAREKAEATTDTIVQNERDRADLKISTARLEADASRDVARAAHGADEYHSSDASMNKARHSSDQAIEKERTRIDFAIVREREVKTTMADKLLSEERGMTDKNLATERTRTDIVMESSSVRLSKEVADHSKTKFSLTSRDELLAIVSHDLRNPLGAISSCLDMLLDEVKERNIDERTQRWLELAKRNADASLRLISDILDSERVAEGKLHISPEKFDIGLIIRESMDTFVHSAATKNILLRSIPATLTGEINCDRGRILQVLSNLIGNALKFTPEQGKVVVKSEWAADVLTISVCDTGPGIPADQQIEIFEKYSQLRSKDRTGLGLGLHISKTLVEAHGGKLWVESTFGHGSTFFFTLPRAATASQSLDPRH